MVSINKDKPEIYYFLYGRITKQLVYYQLTVSLVRVLNADRKMEVKNPSPALYINIIDYNQYMGGVDHNDQIRQYYSVRLKSRKFYKYIFWFLFDVTIVNTYILSHYIPTTSKTNLKYIEFQTELARQLIGDYNSRKRSGRPSLVPVTRHMSPQHYPVRAKRSKCNHCYNTTQHLKYTFWWCDTCNKYLCHTGDLQSDCFLTYHKKAKIY